MISEVLSSLLDTITGLISDFHDTQNDIVSYLAQLCLSGFSYIFDLFIYDFTSTIFRNFDYDRLVFNGQFAISSLFSFSGFDVNNPMFTENFFFFFVGLLVMVFVFKLFFKFFMELMHIFFGALKSGLG